MNQINVNELKNLNNINLIDIRSIEKYNDNHIPGAINIPKILLVKDYLKYLDRNKIYYIYCERGEQSLKVCKLLSNLGYRVINVIGGYQNWILNN
ncbi:MAG: rhodanese-like domain-containing protein [Bacilli bacterium]|nr:rhodanese-like domain-containing protein [Bacilli bacterium]